MRNLGITLLAVDVLAAVADPVRREILGMLRRRPMAAGEIASAFAISRPAISRHLRVLREHGLALDEADEADGRGRVYRLDVAPLAEVEAWLAELRAGPVSAFNPFDALETEVHRTRRERRASARSATTSTRSSA